jgi:hypothetical protein
VLRDQSGQPSAGTVRVYAWPHHERPMSLPLLGEAQAGADGAFVVTAADDARLAKLARQRDGWLDMIAVGETPGYQGRWVFTGFIVGEQRAVKSVAPRDVTTTAGVARASGPTRSPDIRITAKRRLPAVVRAAQVGGEPPSNRCRPEYQTLKPLTTRRWALIGELNNAYNDGTWGRFTYGRQRYADSWIGVAWDPPDVGDVTVAPIIEDEEHITDSGRATFPAARRRWSRRLRSTFEYVRLAVRNNTCAAWDVYVRPESWIGDTDSSIKQRGALNRCDPNAFRGGFEGGSGFWRATSEAVRWTRGVNAFGIKLTSRSGFSENVTLAYRFGGPIRKGHYLCGPDGRQSPYQAGRVFSGALRR